MDTMVNYIVNILPQFENNFSFLKNCMNKNPSDGLPIWWLEKQDFNKFFVLNLLRRGLGMPLSCQSGDFLYEQVFTISVRGAKEG